MAEVKKFKFTFDKQDVLHDFTTIPYGFIITICGPSQSGKTCWIYNLIENIEQLISPVPIVYLHGTDYQPIFDGIKKLGILDTIRFINCKKDIPSLTNIPEIHGDSTLLILDDLMLVMRIYSN